MARRHDRSGPSRRLRWPLAAALAVLAGVPWPGVAGTPGETDRPRTRLEADPPPQLASPRRPVRENPAGHGGPSLEPRKAAELLVETRSVVFDEVVPGVDTEAPTAVVMRVVSPDPWCLRLRADGWLTGSEGGDSVSISRLSWRSPLSGNFMEFRDDHSAVVACGPPTSGAGSRVAVDLRLRFDVNDALGTYQGYLEPYLEPR